MDNGKNVLGVILLIIIILTFVVGGYFLMDYVLHEEKESKNESKEIVDLKIDNTKDYIYYEDGTHVLHSEEIHKENVIINFTTMNDLNDTLKNEVNDLYNKVEYIKDKDLPTADSEGNAIAYNTNDEGIYSIYYREYEDNKFGDYVSLLVKDFYYDIINGTKPVALKSYVIDLNDGKLYTEEELLNKFGVSWDSIKEKIRSRLTNTQVLVEDQEVIDIEGTINNLEAYALHINKVGKLSITFIVKSNQNNYNDSVEIN